MDLAPGTLATPTLRLLEPLGQGAMGSVWICEHSGLAAQVAVKFLASKNLEKNRERLARFQREAASAAQLTSPYAVRTFEHGTTEDGTPYLIMELLKGESLSDRLQREGKLSLPLTVRILDHVAKALSEAHKLGMIHRDIKPENIFLVGQGDELMAKVLDFGTVKDTRQGNASMITSAGALVGTPAFMSPEQLLGSEVDQRADLWSLGVVAYRALTGSLPFDKSNPHALCVTICRGEFELPTEVDPQLPQLLDTWTKRALALRPHERFGSAAELANSFRRLVDSGAYEIDDEETQPFSSMSLFDEPSTERNPQAQSSDETRDDETRDDDDGPGDLDELFGDSPEDPSDSLPETPDIEQRQPASDGPTLNSKLDDTPLPGSDQPARSDPEESQLQVVASSDGASPDRRLAWTVLAAIVVIAVLTAAAIVLMTNRDADQSDTKGDSPASTASP